VTTPHSVPVLRRTSAPVSPTAMNRATSPSAVAIEPTYTARPSTSRRSMSRRTPVAHIRRPRSRAESLSTRPNDVSGAARATSLHVIRAAA